VPITIVEHFINTAAESNPSVVPLDWMSEGRKESDKRTEVKLRDLDVSTRKMLEDDPTYQGLDARSREIAEMKLRMILSSDTLQRTSGFDRATPENIAKFTRDFQKSRQGRVESFREKMEREKAEGRSGARGGRLPFMP
jgi:hypothetical protein